MQVIDGRCFSYCPSYVSVVDAEAACVNWSGHLAGVRDADENAWLRAQTTQPIWIGYVQDAAATTPAAGWSWLDGNPSLYTQWYLNEPQDLDGTEDGQEQCALIYYNTGEWVDDACSDVWTYACSR